MILRGHGGGRRVTEGTGVYTLLDGTKLLPQGTAFSVCSESCWFELWQACLYSTRLSLLLTQAHQAVLFGDLRAGNLANQVVTRKLFPNERHLNLGLALSTLDKTAFSLFFSLSLQSPLLPRA